MIAFRVAVAELRDALSLWVAVSFVAWAAGVAGSVCGVLVETAVRVGDVRELALLSVAGTTATFTAIAILSVLGSVSAQTIALQWRRHALWQLIGFTPRAVSRMARLQILIVGMGGAAVGAWTGLVLAPSFVSLALRDSAGLRGVTFAESPQTALIVAGTTLLVIVGASGRAARAAGATPPLAALRDRQARRPGVIWRVVVAAGLVLTFGGMVQSIPGALSQGAAQSLLVGPVLIAAMAVLGPFIAVPVTRLWSAAVPAGRSAAWTIARANVIQSLRLGGSASTALVVAIGLPVCLVTGRATVLTALDRASSESGGGVALILGGAVLLSAVGAAAGTFMSTHQQADDREIAKTLGAAPAFASGTAALECLMLWTTASIIVAFAAFVTAGAEWWVLVSHDIASHPRFAGTSFAVAGLGCAVLLLVAALAPILTPTIRELGRRTRTE